MTINNKAAWMSQQTSRLNVTQCHTLKLVHLSGRKTQVQVYNPLTTQSLFRCQNFKSSVVYGRVSDSNVVK